MARPTRAPFPALAAAALAVLWASAVVARSAPAAEQHPEGILVGHGTPGARAAATQETPPAGQTPPRAGQQAPAAGEYVGDETCVTCHEEEQKVLSTTMHGRADHPRSPAAKLGCETCHGPGAKHADDPEAPGLIRAFHDEPPRELNDTCLTCHERGSHALWEGSVHESRNLACSTCHSVHEFRSEEALLKTRREMDTCASCHRDKVAKIDRSGHMPLREGKMDCSTCHNPHGSTNVRLLNRGDSLADACTSCHADKRGPFLWEHAPTRDGCATCHDPHGSSNERMLVTKPPLLCQRCHIATRHPSTIYDAAAIASSQGIRVYARSCVTCHSNVHGSNHPSGQRFIR